MSSEPLLPAAGISSLGDTAHLPQPSGAPGAPRPRRPTAMLLKPAFPGASIADVAFLGDGLSMAVPTGSTSGSERALSEPWIYDPTRRSLAQFPIGGSGLWIAKVAISPDGHQLAY